MLHSHYHALWNQAALSSPGACNGTQNACQKGCGVWCGVVAWPCRVTKALRDAPRSLNCTRRDTQPEGTGGFTTQLEGPAHDDGSAQVNSAAAGLPVAGSARHDPRLWLSPEAEAMLAKEAQA